MTTGQRCRTRRSFLADTGMGFTGLALGAMLARQGIARAGEAPTPPVAKAKSVIWIFLCGGVSHVESFDPKPALNRYAGKSIEATPYKDVLNPSRLKDLVSANPQHGGRKILMGLNTGFRKYGESGLEVGDWWRHVGACADDIAVVRSLWTTDNDHGAQLQFHTGRHVREGAASDDRLVGLATASARSTRTCPSTSSWASRPAIAAAARGPTARPTSGPNTPASGSTPDAKRAAAVRRAGPGA